MVSSGSVLWLQIAYLSWQFVRGEKYCRVPYALAVHTFMWVIGRWDHPFASRNYLVLETGRKKFYVSAGGAESVQSTCISRTDRYRVEVSHPDEAPDLVVISIPAVNYKLCIPDSRKNETFLWNYLRDEPECLARVADLLLPNLAILDRISDLEGLRMMCQGDYIPQKRSERFLAMPDRKHELNQNFIRLLSTIPLMAQAKGYEDISVWISVGIIFVDQLSLFFNWIWQGLKSLVFYSFTAAMTDRTYFQRRTQEMLCMFFSTVSTKLKCSDQVRRNLIKVTKGELVYTMDSQFNLADFEKIAVREFTRKRKTPRPYSEEEFGMFTYLGDDMKTEEGTPVITHYIDGSRIDSLFHGNGWFYNYRNNEAIHLGFWKREDTDPKDSEDAKDSKDFEDSKDSSKDSEDSSKDSEDSSKDSEDSSKDSDDPKDSKDSKDVKDAEDSEDNYNNLQDLLQIMEEMQMLPVTQTENGDFRSVDFNMFVCPRRSLKDLIFLVAKKTAIIGG